MTLIKKTMNKINIIRYRPLLLVGIALVLIIVQACQDEFLPEPMGEAIPPAELSSLSEVLAAEGYNLLKRAWERSNIDEIIAAEVPKNKLTFLMPNNEALSAAGYTEAFISAADPKDLDTLLAYHILREEITEQGLISLPSYKAFSSLLAHGKYKEGIRSGQLNVTTVPYQYTHILEKKNGGFLVNGSAVHIEKEIAVSKGNMLAIDHVLQRPEKQMIDVLKEDGRFSLFLKAMDLNVSIYDDFVISNFSAPYVGYRYLTDFNYNTKGTEGSEFFTPHVIRSTLFAPTDDAFHQMGIHTEKELEDLNRRVRNLNLNNNGISTPVDSLLRHHKIGEAGTGIDIDWNLFMGIMVMQQSPNVTNSVFYANSLNNTTLGDYDIIPPYVTNPKKLEFDFGTNGSGQVTVKHKGSSAEAATVIKENINTIQGPIHVVDRLIVPKDFSMWHK